MSEEAQENDAEASPRRWPWALGGALLLAAAAAGVWVLTRPPEDEASSPPEPPLVRGVAAAPVSEIMIRQTGFVRPRAEVSVTPQVTGRIQRVGPGFVLGGRVAQGDLLILLERDRFEADVARAEASVAQAEAALAEARISRDRQAELEARNFSSEAELQQSIVSLANAEANLAAAEAELTRVRSTLSDTVIRAPFDALVTAASAAPGQLLAPGQTVGTLVSAGAVEIQMGLVEPDLALLGSAARAIGGEVRVLTPDGTMLATGVVTGISPRIEAATRTTALIVVVTDPFDGRDPRPLRVDELVSLELPVVLQGAPAVRIPAEALKRGDVVWRVADGRLSRQEVRVLTREDRRLVVTGGALSGGDVVMLSDLAAASDGQEVRVSEEEMPEAEERAPVGAATIGGGMQAGPAAPVPGAPPAPDGATGSAQAGSDATGGGLSRQDGPPAPETQGRAEAPAPRGDGGDEAGGGTGAGGTGDLGLSDLGAGIPPDGTARDGEPRASQDRR